MHNNGTYGMAYRMEKAGIDIPIDDVDILRKASMTLHRWHELECGTENGCITVECDKDGNEYAYWYNSNNGNRTRIPNREKGAKNRIWKACERNRLKWFIQTDPRGCALYISKDELNGSNYNRGFAVCD